MESKLESYEKEAQELYSELYLMNEGRVIGLGEPKSSAFKENGSVYKACVGIYKHINTFKTKTEREFWLVRAKDTQFLQKILWKVRNDKDVLMNIERGDVTYDFIKEYCDYYERKVERFFIDQIEDQESGEAPSPEDKKRIN